MATLNAEQKTFIVERYACFERPTNIVDQFEEQFGFSITKQQVDFYRPEREYGRPLADRWCELHAEVRRRFLEKIGQIPIANEAYRLQVLQRQLQAQLDRGDRANPQVVMELLQQAAKERGGQFTNHRILEHDGEVKTSGVLLVPVSDSVDDWESRARMNQSRNGDDVSDAVKERMNGNGRPG